MTISDFLRRNTPQDFLVRGTPVEIRNEVKKLKEELGGGGGCIISNGITVQADVPLDNMVAMIDEVRNMH